MAVLVSICSDWFSFCFLLYSFVEADKCITINEEKLNNAYSSLSSSLIKFILDVIIEYNEQINRTNSEQLESNEVVETLNESIPSATTTNFDVFSSELETETEYLLFGQHISTYKLKEEKFTSYLIHRVNQNFYDDHKFVNWFKDIEAYLEIVLPKPSTLNKKDSSWLIYLVYEQYHNDHSGICYAPIGFTKVYSSYVYPNKKQAKIR